MKRSVVVLANIIGQVARSGRGDSKVVNQMLQSRIADSYIVASLESNGRGTNERSLKLVGRAVLLNGIAR